MQSGSVLKLQVGSFLVGGNNVFCQTDLDSGQLSNLGVSGGLTERWIEKLEEDPTRPRMSSAVTVRLDAKVLLVEALYWGLRRMVEAMKRDAQLMSRAETFLVSKI